MPSVADQIRALYQSESDQARLATAERVRTPLANHDAQVDKDGDSHAAADARTRDS